MQRVLMSCQNRQTHFHVRKQVNILPCLFTYTWVTCSAVQDWRVSC